MATDLLDAEDIKVSQNAFVIVLWVLTGTSFLFLTFRIHVQLRSFRRLFIDDFIVSFAWVVILSAAILWQVEGKVLYESYAVSAGTTPLTATFLPRFNKLMRCLAPLEILFYSALWSVKFSFMTFFYRLSSKIKYLRNWWYIVLFATISVYIASIGDIEYKCSLGGIDFIINQCSKFKHIHYENRSFWANAVGDVVTDLMILSIPILLLWSTRISSRKKIILISIFSATTLIMVIAIIRVVVGTTYDREMNIAWLCFWSFVEVNTAIIISCVASLRQLLITSQSRAESGGATYQTPYAPMLQNLKNSTVRHIGSSLQSPTSDQMMMSPLSTVHVRHDWDVTFKVTEQGERVPRLETSFD
ncbi:uncharacterized protein N7443_005658 [Penicillium atrosanguineum]|uniref:uncharacterized protein n=1 Tax=Penicillium atrosanguineum TaxID=1132637 RepID=UPI0023896BA6|nr:uncharacterized protein N7443_005658 [Penicillium atrosanguineum]KAJ5300656.1 hypothetical protein N7443_005658 [Penicillium atrosanguineum]